MSAWARAVETEQNLTRNLSFGALATLTGGVGVWMAEVLVSRELHTLVSRGLDVVGAAVGFVAPFLFVRIGAWLRAPTWQRNEAIDALREALDTTLEVELVELKPKRPPGWEGHTLGSAVWPYRLSLSVRNSGPEDDFEVWVLPGIKGLDDEEYGDFPLQWDLTPTYSRRIPRARSRKLHVAKAIDSHLRFLGPWHEYKVFTPDEISAEGLTVTLDIRSANAPQFEKRTLRIGFDDDGTPAMWVIPDDPPDRQS